MKKILFFLLLLWGFTLSAQDQSVVYSRLIKGSQDTVWCDLFIWKKLNEDTFVYKIFNFYNQDMISLDSGTYIFQYIVGENEIFVEKLKLEKESIVVLNVLVEPTPLRDFNFSEVIYLRPEEFDIAISRKRITYIEF